MEFITTVLGTDARVSLTNQMLVLSPHRGDTINTKPRALRRGALCIAALGHFVYRYNRSMKTKILLSTLLAALPGVALAQFGGIDTFFLNVMQFMNNILVPFVFAIALLFFIFGMFNYFIRGGASEASQEKGKQMIVYSVAGFVLMLSIWGIVNLVASGLFGTTTTPPNLPSLPGSYGGSSTGGQYTPPAVKTTNNGVGAQ